jgi:hypothetical protein
MMRVWLRVINWPEDRSDDERYFSRHLTPFDMERIPEAGEFFQWSTETDGRTYTARVERVIHQLLTRPRRAGEPGLSIQPDGVRTQVDLLIEASGG